MSPVARQRTYLLVAALSMLVTLATSGLEAGSTCQHASRMGRNGAGTRSLAGELPAATSRMTSELASRGKGRSASETTSQTVTPNDLQGRHESRQHWNRSHSSKARQTGPHYHPTGEYPSRHTPSPHDCLPNIRRLGVLRQPGRAVQISPQDLRRQPAYRDTRIRGLHSIVVTGERAPGETVVANLGPHVLEEEHIARRLGQGTQTHACQCRATTEPPKEKVPQALSGGKMPRRETISSHRCLPYRHG